MASVSNRPNGHRWVTFKAPNGKRQTVRLGPASASQADAFKTRVERLLVAKRLGETPDPATIEWLADLGDDLYDKLAKCQLVNSRGARTVGELVSWYIDRYREHCKRSTLTNITVGGEALKRYFGSERRINSITCDHADKFRLWLSRDGAVGGGELAPTTVSRLCRRGRQFFAAALKRRWIQENPFGELRNWIDTNPDRDEYVTVDAFTAVLAEASDLETKLMFTLVRYAGLRCPSEVRPLEWAWVDWAHGTLFVKAPKTERHQGHESRFVPIAPELRTLLDQAWSVAPPGARFIFAGLDITNAAIAGRLESACRRAGLVMWPKPFVNLRASCEYDWLRKHPLDMVAAWMGHSPRTMLQHYNRVVKEQSARQAASALQVENSSNGALQKAKRQNRSRRTDLNSRRTDLNCGGVQISS